MYRIMCNGEPLLAPKSKQDARKALHEIIDGFRGWPTITVRLNGPSDYHVYGTNTVTGDPIDFLYWIAEEPSDTNANER